MKITGFELCGSTYTQFFSINIVLENLLLINLVVGRRADYAHEHMEILVYMTDSGSNLPWAHVLAFLKKTVLFQVSCL